MKTTLAQNPDGPSTGSGRRGLDVAGDLDAPDLDHVVAEAARDYVAAREDGRRAGPNKTRLCAERYARLKRLALDRQPTLSAAPGAESVRPIEAAAPGRSAGRAYWLED